MSVCLGKYYMTVFRAFHVCVRSTYRMLVYLAEVRSYSYQYLHICAQEGGRLMDHFLRSHINITVEFASSLRLIY